ncbi:type IV pilin protein [Legionella dresdenensis]|uniref:Type IV pilin protein n=1 Tax=Legionella dresdenensis TaxID=450200 RepID=A0ABV8CE03_9GAMM
MKKGFTLVELLVAMVIFGILIAIAYPSYLEYITRARRSDGQSALLDLAGRMERYYSEHNTYVGATMGTGGASDIVASNLSPEGWYQLAITATAAGYTLEARPRNQQSENDTRCQTLTLNNLGVKGIAAGPSGLAPSGPVTRCW